MQYEKLVSESIKAQGNAYAPYSNLKVGAALLTKSGKIYTGCNVENKSFGATICAERSAVSKAISEGETDFSVIAITSSANGIIAPCGICRQVLNEFSPDMIIVLSDAEGIFKMFTAAELLPENDIPV